MYTFICLLLIGAGGGLAYIFPYEANPGKAVLAIILIGLGLFLLIFRGKDAVHVGKAADIASWWWFGR